jgi:hypothetical protein
MIQPFHLAIPVQDLVIARNFYGTILGCPEGRTDTEWIDFDLFGHQLVAHMAPAKPTDDHRNEVDGRHVPIPHFGVVLPWQQFEDFAQRLRDHGVKFEIAPYVRFNGLPGEQSTMFFYDPFGNALEFKAFKDISRLFAKSLNG